MRIADLPGPVRGAKSDWVTATKYIGFTPNDGSHAARERRRATIQRQCSGGYVMEYITQIFEQPNPGFETDPVYLAQKEAHGDVAGRLIAVHRIKPSNRSAIEIMGVEAYEHMQDMWANGERRWRWSVSFPIIESYDIADRPLANEVLGAKAMQRIFGHPSATLRPFNDHDRKRIADLTLKQRATDNAWIGIEDDIEIAKRSDVSERNQKLMQQDFDAVGALEGDAKERKINIRQRAAKMADDFARKRMRADTLYCDQCGYDPAALIAGTPIKARSILDVHHMDPLAEGIRRTTEADLCLLCPTCHRFVHQLANKLSDPEQKRAALRPRLRCP
jgi:5-methylcytosine-specific restriction protein A